MPMKSLPDDVDDELVPLLTLMNAHPAFETTLSCAGHYRWCSCFLLDKSIDDRDLDWAEEVIHESCADRFCSSSHAPFLQVKIAEPFCSKFLHEFKQCKPARRLHSDASESPRGEVVISYTLDNDEGFRPDWRDKLLGPAFDLFWQQVFRAFAETVNCSEKVALPNEFKMQRKWYGDLGQCYHCDERVWQKDEEPIADCRSWKDTELFYDDHYERSIESQMLGFWER